MQWCEVMLEGCGQLAALLRSPVYRDGSVRGGAGKPVLLIPGLFAGDWTLLVLAGWLRRLGYQPYLSGLDWNVVHPSQTGQWLKRRLAYIVQETGQPVTIIGHSLGGMLGRFLSFEMPGHVTHVIALGSPVYSPLAAYTPESRDTIFPSQAEWETTQRQAVRRRPAHDLLVFLQRVFAPLPPDVRFTAIFSKQDEVVNWRACIDPDGESREVSGRHLSLVVNRGVYTALAEVLAA